jgi:hypothetical protein
VDIGSLGPLADFRYLNAQGIIGPMNQIAGWLDSVRNVTSSGWFNTTIPLVGKSLRELINLQGGFAKGLLDLLETAKVPTFGTLQEFIDEQPAIIDAVFHPDSDGNSAIDYSNIGFNLALLQVLEHFELPLGFDQPLGAVGNLSSRIRMMAANDFAATTSPVAAALLINGQTEIQLGSIAAADTPDNLVAQFDAALTASLAATEFKGAIDAQLNGARIVLTSDSPAVRSLKFLYPGLTDPALHPLGFSPNQTDNVLDLQATIESNFAIGLDLKEVGGGLAHLSPNTPLAGPLGLYQGRFATIADFAKGSLQPGSGIDMEIRLRDGHYFYVTLDGAETIGEVLQLVEQSTEGLVAARLYDDLNGDGVQNPDEQAQSFLILEDLTKGPNNFSILRVDGSFAGFAGTGLGIYGEDSDGNGIIRGAALHGDSIVDHVFIGEIPYDNPGTPGVDPFLKAMLSMKITDFDALGTFGPAGIEITDGHGALSASLAIDSLLDPDTRFNSDGRIYLDELFAGLTPAHIVEFATPRFEGSLSLTLPVKETQAMHDRGFTVVQPPAAVAHIIVSWADLSDPQTLSIATPGL